MQLVNNQSVVSLACATVSLIDADVFYTEMSHFYTKSDHSFPSTLPDWNLNRRPCQCRVGVMTTKPSFGSSRHKMLESVLGIERSQSKFTLRTYPPFTMC